MMMMIRRLLSHVGVVILVVQQLTVRRVESFPTVTTLSSSPSSPRSSIRSSWVPLLLLPLQSKRQSVRTTTTVPPPRNEATTTTTTSTRDSTDEESRPFFTRSKSVGGDSAKIIITNSKMDFLVNHHFHNNDNVDAILSTWMMTTFHHHATNTTATNNNNNNNNNSTFHPTDHSHNDSLHVSSLLPTPHDDDDIHSWSLQDHMSFLRAIQERFTVIPPNAVVHQVRYVSSSSSSLRPTVEFYRVALQALTPRIRTTPLSSTTTTTTTTNHHHRHHQIQTACREIVSCMTPNMTTHHPIVILLLHLYCDRPEHVLALRHLLLRRNPRAKWSESIWIRAIQTCEGHDDRSRRDYHHDSIRETTASQTSPRRRHSRNWDPSRSPSEPEINATRARIVWTCAKELFQEYLTSASSIQVNKKARTNRTTNSIPSERMCLTMLQLCVNSRNVTAAMTWIDRLLGPAGPVDHIVTTTTTTTSTASIAHFQMTPRLWAMLLKVCAVAGDHQTAYEVLHKMVSCDQVPNVRHGTAYLKALVESNEVEMGAQFLAHMTNGANPSFSDLRIDGTPDLIAVKTVLNGCVLVGNYTLARQICDSIKNGLYGDHVQMDEACFNMLLSTCTNSTIAADILREIRLTRRHRWGVVRASVRTYTQAIATCRTSYNVDHARSFLALARNDGIVPDTFMYSSAIWVAAQCNKADLAMDLLNEMIECNTTPTVVSYNGVFSALASCGNADTILATFQNMKRTYSNTIHPNFMSYFHITRCLQKIKEDEERLAYLWRVYALMDSRDRQVNVGGHLFEALIQTYGALGHFDEAMKVFDSITGLSNSACLRSILFACSAAEPPEWEMALSLLHASDIVDDGVGPGLVEPGSLCNAMLACSKAGEWEESLQLMRLYGEQSELSIVAVNSLIAACGRAGRPDMSMEVLYEVEGRGMKLDTRSYRSSIIACNQAEHEYRRSLQLQRQTNPSSDRQTAQVNDGFEWWECAISLLRRMKESGLQPDTPTLSSTISACEAAGQWQRALHILQSAMNENATVALNVYCFNAAISACEKGGAWVEALEIYEKMKDQGGTELRPNLVTVSSLILALDSAGQKEFAVNIYREGLRKRYIQSPWRTTPGSNVSTEQIMAMDLHSYSAAMTRAAIRNHMNTLLSRPGKGTLPVIHVDTLTTTISDWVIIVGQGYHSIDGCPILKDTVLSLFRVEFGIDAVVDHSNLGRVVVTANSIQQLISQRRW